MENRNCYRKKASFCKRPIEVTILSHVFTWLLNYPSMIRVLGHLQKDTEFCSLFLFIYFWFSLCSVPIPPTYLPTLFTLQPWLAMSRMSAGIRSPPLISTMSPTTSWSAGISFFSASLRTRACWWKNKDRQGLVKVLVLLLYTLHEEPEHLEWTELASLSAIFLHAGMLVRGMTPTWGHTVEKSRRNM